MNPWHGIHPAYHEPPVNTDHRSAYRQVHQGGETMRMNRRSLILGMGALATGSGAIFSAAAFDSSVTPDADLRVISDERLIVEAGSAFADGGQLDEGDPSLFLDPVFNGGAVGAEFYDNDHLGEKFNNEAEPPAATVSVRDRDAAKARSGIDESNVDNYYGVNDDLGIYSVVKNYDTVRFEKIIRVRNTGSKAHDVGIAYDRGADQYGKHTTEHDGNHVEPDDVQAIWQFEVNVPGEFSFVNDEGPLISPKSGEAGAGTDSTIDDPDDRPNDFVELGPGETVELDLVVDTEGLLGDLIVEESQYQGIEPRFDEEYHPVIDLLDEITVGTWTGN